MLGRNHYAAWEQLLYSVKTGAIAFDHVFGVSQWQYNAEHPKEATAFDEAMASFSIADAVMTSYDFASCGTIVDVGGGNGSLLAEILKVHPRLRGVLADLPHVLDGAQRRLTAENVAERCEVVGADFFKSVPEGDTYLLKWIVHDWDDQRAEMILKNCTAAMNPGGRVLLVESIVEPCNGSSLAKFMDLSMLVLTGGRERTEPEYQSLVSDDLSRHSDHRCGISNSPCRRGKHCHSLRVQSSHRECVFLHDCTWSYMRIELSPLASPMQMSSLQTTLPPLKPLGQVSNSGIAARVAYIRTCLSPGHETC